MELLSREEVLLIIKEEFEKESTSYVWTSEDVEKSNYTLTQLQVISDRIRKLKVY